MSGMKRERSMQMLPSVQKKERQVIGGDNARLGLSSPAAAGAIGTGSATWPRRDAGDLAGLRTAAFLSACGLCGKGLSPGKDAYIYRGELAFCTHECREQHIKREEQIHQEGSDQSGTGATNPIISI